MRVLLAIAAVAAILGLTVRSAYGQAAIVDGIFTNGGTGNVGWNVGANWDTTPNWPSGAGATATFNSPTSFTASSPARSIQMGSGTSAVETVKAITVNLTATNVSGSQNYDTRFTAGTSGSRLVFDSGSSSDTTTLDVLGSGDSKFSWEIGSGAGTAVTLNQDLIINVANTAYSGTTGAFEAQSSITGSGGLTKIGAGKMTLSTATKAYTGATNLNEAWTRMSVTGRPTGTSSVTIASGATLELFGTQGTYTMGAGPLNLNGTGAAAFPGVIRPERNAVGRANTIPNDVVLQSDSLIHVQALTDVDLSHSLTFTGVISGLGRLTQTASNSDQALGRIILTNANTYSGGTTVNGGRMEVTGSTATLGTGDVSIMDPGAVLSAGPGQQFGVAHLIISSGVADAIANNKALSIAGGFTDAAQPASFAELGAGVDEIVASLFLGGVGQLPGMTYGSTASNAMVKSDEFFAGTGMVQVGLLGDFNSDGNVNAADYVTYRAKPSATDAMYAGFRENFGAGPNPGPPLGGPTAVPEPSTFALAGLFGSLILAGRRSRIAKSK